MRFILSSVHETSVADLAKKIYLVFELVNNEPALLDGGETTDSDANTSCMSR